MQTWFSYEGEQMNGDNSNCKVEAVVTIDSKGQIVLPKKLREKAGFKQNEKIALVTFEKVGAISCVLMIKTEKIRDAVTETLSTILLGLC